MKKQNVVFVVVLVVVIVGASYFITSKQVRITELDGMTFEELCNKNKDMWMEMEPWMDGKKISDEKCFGCMIGENHFCTAEEYIEYVKGLRDDAVEQTPDSGEMEHDMHGRHEAMVAHAGKKNAIEIHKYIVEFLPVGIETGEISEVVFSIKEQESGKPVTNLEIVHDKIMHVILVRDDLRYFDHIHPIEEEPGVFSVPYSFKAPGRYRLWVDFTREDMQHIVDFDVDVPLDFSEKEGDRLDGLKVEMRPEGIFKAGEDVKIDFIVMDEYGNAVPIVEKFLAANAHLVAIDESLEEFGHNHDERLDNDNVISFEHGFENIGKHKLWVQFSVDSVERIAEFDVVIGN